MRNCLLSAACAGVLLLAPVAQAQQSVTAEEAREIARDAYIYAYPLVLMQVSRQVATNVAEPTGLISPINQLAHGREFPDPDFTIVVRPNADTLYSSMNFDVSKEPLIVSIPDSGGRYYLLPFLDEWTDIFTVPGKRTTGTEPQTFAIVGPNWHGALPAVVRRYDSPTSFGWLGGRTQTNGKADFEAVHKFQDSWKVVPLSAYGKPYTAPKGTVNPKQDMSAPPDQAEKMDGATFFETFAELMKDNPPHSNDYPIIDRMKRIGIGTGKELCLRQRIERGSRRAQGRSQRCYPADQEGMADSRCACERLADKHDSHWDLRDGLSAPGRSCVWGSRRKLARGRPLTHGLRRCGWTAVQQWRAVRHSFR